VIVNSFLNGRSLHHIILSGPSASHFRVTNGAERRGGTPLLPRMPLGQTVFSVKQVGRGCDVVMNLRATATCI